MNRIKPLIEIALLILLGTFNNAQAGDGKCPLLDTLLEPRIPRLLNQKLHDALLAVTLKPETFPVGSYRYRNVKYPGDVDIFETSEVTLPKEKAKTYFAERLSYIANAVAVNRDLILADFKAGVDERLKINIGKLEGNTIIGYNREAVLKAIQRLSTDGLLTNDQSSQITNLAKAIPTVDEWLALNEAIRLLTTLRWSLDELLKREKILPGGKIIKLSDAIEGSFVKIDVWAPVAENEGYTEVTNIFNLIHIHNGDNKPITTKFADYRESVTADVILFFNEAHRKHLKGIKRLWLLATILKDYDLIVKLMPILVSPASALNQIVSESEVIRGILQRREGTACLPVGRRLIDQIALFEKRIVENGKISLELLLKEDAGSLKTALSALQKDCPNAKGSALSSDSIKLALKNLERLEGKIRAKVEELARKFLVKVGVNPDKPLASLTGKVGVCPPGEASTVLQPVDIQ